LESFLALFNAFAVGLLVRSSDKLSFAKEFFETRISYTVVWFAMFAEPIRRHLAK